jgi:hypothetical protein
MLTARLAVLRRMQRRPTRGSRSRQACALSTCSGSVLLHECSLSAEHHAAGKTLHQLVLLVKVRRSTMTHRTAGLQGAVPAGHGQPRRPDCWVRQPNQYPSKPYIRTLQSRENLPCFRQATLLHITISGMQFCSLQLRRQDLPPRVARDSAEGSVNRLRVPQVRGPAGEHRH